MYRLTAALIATVCLGGAASAAPGEAPPAAEAPTVDRLLGAFRAMSGFEARFVEEKHLALLAAPLESRGRLYFAPPGYLARVVEQPRPSTVVVTPTRLTLEDAAGREDIDLRARPDVKAFVESFMRVLAGDRAGLEAVYRLSLTQFDGGRWTLTLTPRGEPLSRLVKALRIEGRGRAVETVRVDEQGGDYSLIRVLDADPTRTFSAEERARLFGQRGTPTP